MILFKPEHVAPILSGRKTQTRRFGKRRWRVGAVHACYTRPPFAKGGAEPFARVVIRRVRRSTLACMSVEDVVAEGYDSIHDFIEAWMRINGAWNPHAEVWVVEFELAAHSGADHA